MKVNGREKEFIPSLSGFITEGGGGNKMFNFCGEIKISQIKEIDYYWKGLRETSKVEVGGASFLLSLLDWMY